MNQNAANQLPVVQSAKTPVTKSRILKQFFSDHDQKLKIELAYEHPLEMLQMQGGYVSLGLGPNIMQEIW